MTFEVPDRAALLLTDVVDSTRLAEALGVERNGALWAEHDRHARQLVADFGGYELERTDGIGAVFASAEAAVAFALAYRRVTAALDPPLVVRAALHSGDLTVRQNPPEHVARGAKPIEVDGLGVAVAARILSVTRGGQVLLSAGARADLGASALAVVSHGHWRLKGVTEPVALFEVGEPGAPCAPPQDAEKAYRVVQEGQRWLPAREVPHSLPIERDAFVGREAELGQLARALDGGAHLVSLLGIGGTGKTRLVTHFAWNWLGEYPGGAWFCDLSEARGPEGIAQAVGRALGVPIAGEDAVEQLGAAIAGRKKCLVLLDNFEQVARWAPDTLGRWLDRAPAAHFVVTTREVLGLPGERTVALPPLQPADGVALFVARAEQSLPGFALTPENRDDVHALVRLLDALPLALELAAARVRVMTPRTLLQRMSDRFKLLSSSGGRHTRQATLRGALDWSWDLLTPDERRGLAQLSVLGGGFDLEATEAVLALEQAWAVDVVQALVDKSLVRRVADDRFDVLITVQDYAAEKLDAHGERLATEGRHTAWFAARGTPSALAALDTHGGTARLRALAGEVDNVTAAAQRAIVRGDGRLATHSLRAAWAVLRWTGPFGPARALAKAAGELGGLEPVERAGIGEVWAHASWLLGAEAEARAGFEAALACAPPGAQRIALHLHLGRLCAERGDLSAADVHDRAALLASEQAGDRQGQGAAHGNRALRLLHQGQLEDARLAFQTALALHREVGDRVREGGTLANFGNLVRLHGAEVEAIALYEQALVVDRELGNRRFEAIVLGNYGNALFTVGRVEDARSALEASVQLLRDMGNLSFMAAALGGLGQLEQRTRGVAVARPHFEEALTCARAVGNDRIVVASLVNLARLHVEVGEPAVALAYLDEAFALPAGLVEALPVLQVHFLRCRALDALGRPEEALAACHVAEHTLRQIPDPAGNLIVLLGARGLIQARLGATELARAALREAEALAGARDALTPDQANRLALLRAALS